MRGGAGTELCSISSAYEQDILESKGGDEQQMEHLADDAGQSPMPSCRPSLWSLQVN